MGSGQSALAIGSSGRQGAASNVLRVQCSKSEKLGELGEKDQVLKF